MPGVSYRRSHRLSFGVSARILLVAFLAVTQLAQGVFAGTTLCREETGTVALEWAANGRCGPAGARAALPCIDPAPVAADHCAPCLDIPLPVETSLRSAVAAPDIQPAALSFLLSPLLSVAAETRAPSASGFENVAARQLRVVRLLI